MAWAYLRDPEMDSLRQNKVNSLLQKELAAVFQLEGRHLMPGGMITITAVRVSPDMSMARVYLSLFPSKGKEAVLEKVRAEMHHLRGMLGRRVGKNMRIVPELLFNIDDSLDRAEEIDRLLKS